MLKQETIEYHSRYGTDEDQLDDQHSWNRRGRSNSLNGYKEDGSDGDSCRIMDPDDEPLSIAYQS
jgi:hypothetical protein